MELTKQDSGYRLELYGYEIHNLKLTLNNCDMEYSNFIINKYGLNDVLRIPTEFIDLYMVWSSEFKTRLSNDFYVDSRDIYYIVVALEYSIVVDKYHAQFICEFRDLLSEKLKDIREEINMGEPELHTI